MLRSVANYPTYPGRLSKSSVSNCGSSRRPFYLVRKVCKWAGRRRRDDSKTGLLLKNRSGHHSRHTGSDAVDWNRYVVGILE